MAEEYMKTIDELIRKVNRGEVPTEEVSKLAELIVKMTKESREKALQSPGLTPDEAWKAADKLFLDADLLFMIQFAIQLAASYIPLTNAAPMLAKTFEAPSFRWQFDIAYRIMDLKQQVRILAPLTRYLNQTYLPNIIDSRTATTLKAQGRMNDTDFINYMAQSGFSVDEADKYLLASRVLPGLHDLSVMEWRGHIDIDAIKRHPTYLSINPADREALLAIQEPIPGSGDLTTMVAREAFPLANLPDAPAEYISWMAKQGYSKQWANAYWHIHYRYVPINTLYELFHRGFITLPELTTYLTIEDLAPFKRPGQSKTDLELAVEASYALLPRIDLRFGWFTGALTDAEVEALYEKYGLKAEDATKELGIQKARILEPYRRGYLSTLQLAYRRGKITADGFRSKVVAEKFPGEVADWLIKSEDLRSSLGAGVEASNEERALTKSDLIRLYRRGLIDQARLRSGLINLNYSAAEIDLHVADADYQAPVEAREVSKLVSVTDLEALYKRGLVNASDTVMALHYRGYPDPEIDKLMLLWNNELAEARAAAEESTRKSAEAQVKTATVGDLEQLYKRGQLPVQELISELNRRHYPDAEIDRLRLLWNLEITEARAKEEAASKSAEEARVKTVTVGDLEQLYKRHELLDVDLIRELHNRGYPDPEIDRLRLLWTLEAKPSPPRLPTLSEARAMFEQGIITAQQHTSLVAATGISPDWVPGIAEAEQRAALRSEIEAVITRLTTLFDEGFIVLDDLKARILELGLGEQLAAYWSLRAETTHQARILRENKDAVLNAYLQDRATKEQATSLLRDLGMDEGVISEELQIADLKRMGRYSA